MHCIGDLIAKPTILHFLMYFSGSEISSDFAIYDLPRFNFILFQGRSFTS
jgi:hypothetical protein